MGEESSLHVLGQGIKKNLKKGCSKGTGRSRIAALIKSFDEQRT